MLYHLLDCTTEKIVVLKTENENEVFLNLENNKNIIIQKPDKGNSVVAIDFLTYAMWLQ